MVVEVGMMYRKSTKTDDVLAIIKWLRQHGERGIDFDFSGGKNIDISITNPTLEVMYILRWE